MNVNYPHRPSGLLCVVMAAGLITAGLWPFAFWPANQVRWLEDGRGLRFSPDGVAYDPDPLPKISPPPPDRTVSLTVELWVEADLEPHDDVHHILTIHDEHLPSNLVLCQWRSALLLRVPSKTKQGFRETGIRDALKAHHPKLITMTCGPEGTSWYLDGIQVKKSPDFTIPSGSLDGRLVLGDSAEGKHAWSGRLQGLALFNRTLDDETVRRHSHAWTTHLTRQLASEPGLMTLVLFDEGTGQWAKDRSPHFHRLLIPQTYRTRHKTVLRWPSRTDGSIMMDVLVNIIGFVPFGFLLYWRFHSAHSLGRLRSAAFAILTGSIISLTIEVTQIWLPNRDSSSLDLVCNVLGTLLGACAALFAQTICARLRRPRLD